MKQATAKRGQKKRATLRNWIVGMIVLIAMCVPNLLVQAEESRLQEDKKHVTNAQGEDVDKGTARVGDILTYTIDWVADIDAKQLTVTDRLEAGMKYVKGSATEPVDYDEAEGKLVWTFPDVVYGQTGTVSFQVEVTDEVVDKTLYNIAIIQLDKNKPKASNEVETSILPKLPEPEPQPEPEPEPEPEPQPEPEPEPEPEPQPEPKPEPVKVVVEAQKYLEGRPLRDGEFTFVLREEDGDVVATAKNDAKGSVAFEPIALEAEGRYDYTLAERKETLGGVEYDETVYRIRVVVTKEAGKLQAQVTYRKQGSFFPSSEATFVNRYTPKPTEVTLAAKKVLLGRPLLPGEFTFVLEDEQGRIVAEATNDSFGVVVFDKISFAKPGTYRFYVREQKGDLEDVRYDERVFSYLVTVEDSLDGNLVATVKMPYGPAIFCNVYDKQEVPPVEPEEPEQPPVEPEEPEQPPVEPEEPEQPPVEPEEPEQPSKPEKPSKPERPEKPEKPEQPENPDKSPQTGDETMIWSWMLWMGMALVGMTAAMRKRWNVRQK